jgi:rRNA maturation RNase YbeY
MAAGDIFISIDRVSENAQEYGVPFIDEVHRVLVHGLLHLIGYKDDSDKAKNEMRGLEDLYLSLRTF